MAMSPTRRDIIKASAGAVAAALVAGKVQATESEAEPLRIERIFMTNVSAVLSDGRMVTLQCFHTSEPQSAPHAHIGIPQTSDTADADWSPTDSRLADLMTGSATIWVSGAMNDLGIKVRR